MLLIVIDSEYIQMSDTVLYLEFLGSPYFSGKCFVLYFNTVVILTN